uniref:Translin n=1 Tax=Caligus rogercresseyi TaxID=217165 RepID=C1BRD6_CALRO|nr:Translin [Caligus rogercresseyi]|eukprot:TRINITY_DN897_c0_g1_i1.p1 TRINITY_DN897_c0_g1~~TRINITY_DN897_c0_g1_i1.p1  ORF type:complete len:228 (+),score=76.29 TRINITY_DN897_c0_g1_i1:93-776(+)
MASVSKDFEEYLTHMENDMEVREQIRTKVRELDQISREITAVLEKIHQLNVSDDIPAICQQIDDFYSQTVVLKYKELSSVIPSEAYYKYSNMWTFTTQKLVFVVAMRHYLLSESLLTRDEAADKLGISTTHASGGFHLDLEDYFGGVIQMSNELARFTVTSVTRRDYKRPLQIAAFLNELNAGFRLLNLKNDGLRKKFDSLKYDIKKVEGVVYDLSIRNFYNEEESK